jgi:hypothetical protein
MSLPEVKENESLQDYIRRALSEGVQSTAIPQLVINYNKK